MASPKINTRAKKQLNTYEQVITSPYAYLNKRTSLSMDESMLIQIVCRSLRGKDGEISNANMISLWRKIKTRMKRDIKLGSHNNKLFQFELEWDKYFDYFAILSCKATGIFNNLLAFWKRDFKSSQSIIKMDIMKTKLFHKWMEL